MVAAVKVPLDERWRIVGGEEEFVPQGGRAEGGIAEAIVHATGGDEALNTQVLQDHLHHLGGGQEPSESHGGMDGVVVGGTGAGFERICPGLARGVCSFWCLRPPLPGAPGAEI